MCLLSFLVFLNIIQTVIILQLILNLCYLLLYLFNSEIYLLIRNFILFCLLLIVRRFLIIRWGELLRNFLLTSLFVERSWKLLILLLLGCISPAKDYISSSLICSLVRPLLLRLLNLYFFLYRSLNWLWDISNMFGS